jgi:hypothetical protein
MVDAALGADGTETGGILVGVYSGGTPLITHALEVASQNPSRNRFQIPAGITHHLVDCVRRVDPRLGYLGEWHTHPADVRASDVDLSTMRHIARRLRGEPVSPLLLVWRMTGPHRYDVDAQIFVGGRRWGATLSDAPDLTVGPDHPFAPS